jgi:hypothetical protein
MYPWEPCAFNQYGASMGRREDFTTLDGRKLYLRRVCLDSGGYDKGGAYWGSGEPLFCAWDDGWYDGQEVEPIERYLRAPDRNAAKSQLKGARFYR